MGFKIFINILLLSITSVSHFSNIQKPNYQNNNTLDIVSLPYLTTLSLGDELYTEGLVIKEGDFIIPTEELVFQGHDPNNLGDQTITTIYGNKYASFDVYVTNELVYHYLPVGNLFISEFVYLSDDEISIELYNNTNNTIDLADYIIELKNGNEKTNIPLNSNQIESKQAFVAANFSVEDISYLNFDSNITSISEISLKKENVLIDQLLVDSLEPNFKTVQRHFKIYSSSTFFNELEWIITKGDLCNLGTHTLIETIVDHIEMARAYARYVLFGAGMFAAGRVNEAYEAIRKEYNLMSESAKDYFSINKTEKVEGYNEVGKLVSMSFNEAHSRINLLASTSGNESFLPKNKTKLFNNDSLFVFLTVLIVLLASSFYFFRQKYRINK